VPAYRYEAAEPSGQLARGIVDADSPRHARNLLRERGLTPLDVNPVQTAAGGASLRVLGGRLSASELALATRQLASLLSARLPIEQALNAVVEQADRQSVRDRFAAVRSEVVGGQTLAQALAKFPRDFPDVYRALVAAGEQSGDLALVMNRLADYVAPLTYVVPQVVGVFTQTRQQLPLLTVALIATSDFVREYGIWLLAVIVAAVIAFRLALRSPTFRLSWDRRMLTMPIAGRLIRGLNTARFTSTLGILASSGVPLIRALEAGARTLSNESMKANVHDAISRVREGAPLSRALKAGGQFPPMMIHMIASGEATGELPQMLERTATTLSQETERRALTLTSLLEPLLILLMGAVVLVIVLAVLLPIIEINQLVR
jgi:general secretion pathway protein F